LEFPFSRRRDDIAPAFLQRLIFAAKIIVPTAGSSVGIAVVSLFNFSRKRTDDAAAAPHERDAAVVEIPFVFRRRRAHEHVALRIGNDFRRVKRVADVGDELLFLRVIFETDKSGFGPFNLRAAFTRSSFNAENAAGINGFPPSA